MGIPENVMTTIAIIDDQLTSRQVLKQLAASIEGNINVVDFANPLDALDWCSENSPDLVLVDYKMPEMNGIDFIENSGINLKRLVGLPFGFVLFAKRNKLG